MAQVKSQKRIGNIEYRAVVSSWNERKFIEIIRWVPNSLYGKEDEFEKSPFDSKTKNGVVYDDSCRFILDILDSIEFGIKVETYDYNHYKERKKALPIMTRNGTRNLPVIEFVDMDGEESEVIWSESNPNWKDEIIRIANKEE